MIIDYVGGYGYNLDYPTYKALKNCAVVAQSWTHRSRRNLFREIKVNVRRCSTIDYPPQYLSEFIKSLEVTFCFSFHADGG